jgi:hypothetical protein
MAVVDEHCEARNIDMVNRGSSVRLPVELRRMTRPPASGP